MTAENDIKDAIKAGKLLIGTRSVMKNLKAKKLKTVVGASNCPETLVRDIKRYGTEPVIIKGNSSKLGELCGKPFNILLAGIMK